MLRLLRRFFRCERRLRSRLRLRDFFLVRLPRFFLPSRGRRYSGKSAALTGSWASGAGTAARRTLSGISLISRTCNGSAVLPSTPGRPVIRRTAVAAISGAAKLTYAALPSASRITEVTAPCLAHSKRTADSVTPCGILLMQIFSSAGPPGVDVASAPGTSADCRPVSKELRVCKDPVLEGGGCRSSASSSSASVENICATPRFAVPSRTPKARITSGSNALEASRLAVAICAAVWATSLARSAAILAWSANSLADFASLSSSFSTSTLSPSL
mmetsp:Transcript_847/g.2360  ORF Transcript_847/g.2360 Transcript_847/m.2360 type:complete len:273 (-) Transcript_847:664-1482(-)